MNSVWIQLRSMLLLLWCCLRVAWRRIGAANRPAPRPFRVDALQLFLRTGIEDGLAAPLEVGRRRIPPTLVPLSLRRKLRGPEVLALGARPAELITPQSWQAAAPTILYFHGGGYVACSPATHRALVAALAVESGARVYSLDYRLAPEHPFPAAIDDCVAAYRALLAAASAGSRRIILAGDSSGGGLVMATLLAIKQLALPMPAAGVLFSPWVDLTFSSASLRTNESTCYLVRASFPAYRRAYLGERDPKQPQASPLFADLRGMPPLLIQAGGAEMLRDEAEALARAAEAVGVRVQLDVEPRLFHAYQTAVAVLPEAQQAVARAAAFIRASCAD